MCNASAPDPQPKLSFRDRVRATIPNIRHWASHWQRFLIAAQTVLVLCLLMAAMEYGGDSTLFAWFIGGSWFLSVIFIMASAATGKKLTLLLVVDCLFF